MQQKTAPAQGTHPRQITDTILMVRPAAFGYNPQTAEDNAFQEDPGDLRDQEIRQLARKEFDGLLAKLQAVGVNVIVVEDTEAPRKTDAVFPNNWFSTHEDGLIITYPMFSPIRRQERSSDVIDQLVATFGFSRLVRLESWEKQGCYLESTGSIILDRPNRVGYACRSERTDERVLAQWAEMMDFTVHVFDATDENGVSIYHTNVMLALGVDFAVVCLECIRDEAERETVVAALRAGGREIVPITLAQVHAFAGNMLQVQGRDGRYLVMSTSAYNALTAEQIATLQQYSRLLHSPLDTIETYGGGSARCMMAEVFLPPRQ
jgi:hypothetical protein